MPQPERTARRLRDRRTPGAAAHSAASVCGLYADRLAALPGADVVTDLDVRRHVRSCTACRRRVTEFERVRAAVRTARPDALALLERDRMRPGRPAWARLFAAPGASFGSWLSALRRHRR